MPLSRLRIHLLFLFWQLGCWLVCPATACGDAGNEVLRVITYNVQFLPDPASMFNDRPHPDYRASRIAEETSHFDLIGLQETFHETHRGQIIDRLAELWGKRPNTVESPTPAEFFTSGGCLILTERPIVGRGAMVYSRFSKPINHGFRADGFAAKGVIHARVARSSELAEDCIDVYVTHIEARAAHLRPFQYQELADFIQKTSKPDTPVLLMGDLNTRGEEPYPQDPNSQYSQLMKCLQEARPDNEVIDVWPALRPAERGGTTEQESHDIGKRIDYLIICNPPQPGGQLNPVSVEVESYLDEKVVALSDHNAVVAELEWPRR